jgi:hypothetical protein
MANGKPKGSSAFLRIDDLRDVPTLVRRLQTHTDLLSQFLVGKFSRSTKDLLAQSDSPATSEELQGALVREFNALINGSSLFHEELFRQTKLTQEAHKLIEQNPQDKLFRLNRLLLEAIFPGEIASSPEVRQESTSAVLGSAILGMVILIVFFVSEYLFREQHVIEVADKSTMWIFGVGLFFLASVLIVFLMAWDREKVRRAHLYGLAICGLLFIFCLVDASGGLTRSPFVSFYPGILTVAIIIAERPRPIIVLGIVIIICLGLNGILENISCDRSLEYARACIPTVGGAAMYKLKYFLAIVLTLVAMAYADYQKSRAG